MTVDTELERRDRTFLVNAQSLSDHCTSPGSQILAPSSFHLVSPAICVLVQIS
jgi:hypothetical protein